MEIHARPEPVEVDFSRTALIIIDMQNAFGSLGGMFDRVGVPIESIQEAVAPTRVVVDAARRAGVKVVYLKMGFKADLSDLRVRGGAHERFFERMGVMDGVLTCDEWGTEILEELTPESGDTVVWKTRFSGFYETELDQVLQDAGITHLIVTGCTTSICVESTVRDAFFRDYHCIVLEDCTAEPMGANLSRSNHEATTLLFERVFGSVSRATEVVNALETDVSASV